MPYKDRDEQRRYQRERNAKVRSEWLEENGPCVACESWERLEVDHVDPQTKVSHNVWSWSLVRREQELAKCQVLCGPCHWKKTGQENSGMMHGTEAMYGRGKCRCDPCKAARSTARKANRARRKALGLPP